MRKLGILAALAVVGACASTPKADPLMAMRDQTGCVDRVYQFKTVSNPETQRPQVEQFLNSVAARSCETVLWRIEFAPPRVRTPGESWRVGSTSTDLRLFVGAYNKDFGEGWTRLDNRANYELPGSDMALRVCVAGCGQS